MGTMKEFDFKINGIEQEIKNVEKLSERTDKAVQGEEKLAAMRKKNHEMTSKFFEAVRTQDEDIISSMAAKTKASAELLKHLSGMNGLNEKSYKILKKNNEEKLAFIQSEIDGLAKNAKSVAEVSQAYEHKKNAIVEQAAIAQASAEQTYNTQIELAEKAGKDTANLERAKQEQIYMISKKMQDDLKKNQKEYLASTGSTFDKFVSGMTDKMEVYKDTISKKDKKIIADSTAAAEEALGLTGGALKKVSDAAIKAAGESKNATTEAKKTEDAAKKTAEATKKAIDIDETRIKLKGGIEGLKEYRKELAEVGKAAIDSYDVQIAAAGNNVEEHKRLEAERVATAEFYGGKLMKVGQAIEAQEEKEHGLSLLRWQQYAEGFKKVMGDINSVAQQLGNSAKAAIGTVTAGLDDEIKRIDDQLKENEIERQEAKEKNAEKDIEIDKAIKDEKDKLAVATTQDEKDEIQKRINNLTASKKAEETINKEYDAKKNQIDAEKKKIELEKRKWEKAQRKIDMGMQISTAIANVAEGVTKALAKGPIVGQILAGIMAVQGAIQVGILTKQLAKLEDGGLLRGKRHTQGGMRIEGTNIEVEGGEYVVNRQSTSKNLGLVRYINSQRKELTANDMNSYFAKNERGYEPPFSRMFQTGGELPAVEVDNDTNNQMLIEAIKAIRIESKVAVTDIHRVQDEMVHVDGWSGI